MKRKGHSVLHIVAFLLISSAVIRISIEAGPALAQATRAEVSEPTEITTEIADEGTFLAALKRREAELAAREAHLELRLEAMGQVEVQMAAKIEDLVTAEQALSATIAMAETASRTDVAQLTTVYENMKPKEAAALFEEMSPEFAAGFLGMMRPDAAALIMTQLEPATAYSFSVVLAGRNANTATR